MRSHADAPSSSADPTMMEVMRAWRATHPQATFAEIEVEATRQVAALRRDLIAAALEAEPPTPAPACPTCGQRMVRNGTRTRTLITSQTERIPITGARYRCSACGAELFPPG